MPETAWRIGASTGCCIEQPILDVLGAIREAGIDAVEVATPPRHFDPWRESEVLALRDRLGTFGMSPVSIHAPFGGLLDLSDPNPHHRHATIGAILTAAEALRTLGGDKIIVHTSDVPREHQNVQERLRVIRESLHILATACAAIGIVLTVESPLPHLIGGWPDEFAWLIDGLPAGVGVCLDTGHTTLGHHWRRFVEVAGRRLSHVHANDHRGRFDDHLPPGDGILDWHAIGRDLRQVGFDGWIMLELRCPAGPLSEHFARALAQLRARLPA